VGGLAVAVLAVMPGIVVLLFYLFANVYALITGPDFSSDTANVAVVATGLVMSVTVAVLVLAAGATLVGRALTPKRRSR
jgi:hypothetical protein